MPTELQAQRGAEVFSREDTEGVREEVNAQMDAMTTHDGTLNGDHLPNPRGKLFPTLHPEIYVSLHRGTCETLQSPSVRQFLHGIRQF